MARNKADDIQVGALGTRLSAVQRRIEEIDAAPRDERAELVAERDEIIAALRKVDPEIILDAAAVVELVEEKRA